MRRRDQFSIVASPLLVGSITVLITVVAVFLAYNANVGLPFVPTYDVYAKVPDAAGLVRGNEVRIGGLRVGKDGPGQLAIPALFQGKGVGRGSVVGTNS